MTNRDFTYFDVTFRNARKIIQRFFFDEEGVIAIYVALFFAILSMASGFCIDYYRATAVRSEMQRALDSVYYSYTSRSDLVYANDWHAIAIEIFKKELRPKTLKYIETTGGSIDMSRENIEATAIIPLHFGRFFGRGTWKIKMVSPDFNFLQKKANSFNQIPSSNINPPYEMPGAQPQMDAQKIPFEFFLPLLEDMPQPDGSQFNREEALERSIELLESRGVPFEGNFAHDLIHEPMHSARD